MTTWPPPEWRKPWAERVGTGGAPRPADPVKQDDYPLAFWGLVLFTLILFVAPQNNFEVLKPLHLAKVSALVALLVYTGQRLARGASILPSGREFRLMAALIVISLISIPMSLWPGGSVEVMTDLYMKSVLVGILMAQVLTSIKRFKQMLWYMMIFCFIAAMVAFDTYQTGFRVEGYRMMGGWAGISANPNDFALTINLILPFAVAFFTLTKNPIRKGMAGAFMVVGVISILATYSRTGFLTMAVVLMLALVKHVGKGKGLQYVLPAALIIFAIVSAIPADYNSRLESIVDTKKDQTGSAAARLASIHAALDVIQENPIFGVGLGVNTLALNAKGLFWAHVHNIYLQLASEIGIPGLIVFVMLMLQLLKGLRQIQNRLRGDEGDHEVAVLAGACEISLLAYCIAGFFHPVAYHFYFYYLAGFALALKAIVERVPKAVAQPAIAQKPWGPRAPGAWVPVGK
jgi:O-antigen ligase